MQPIIEAILDYLPDRSRVYLVYEYEPWTSILNNSANSPIKVAVRGIYTDLEQAKIARDRVVASYADYNGSELSVCLSSVQVDCPFSGDLEDDIFSQTNRFFEAVIVGQNRAITLPSTITPFSYP